MIPKSTLFTHPEVVLDFWFADSRESIDAFVERRPVWFVPNEEFDKQVAERFSALIDDANGGVLVPWYSSPQSLLALILVLDQFPRNVYRGTPRAFASDGDALSACASCIQSGKHLDLNVFERLFAYMPLQHAESLPMQELSVIMFTELCDSAPTPEIKAELEGAVSYAKLHLEIMERFGRFPHRNEILGRQSTEEEIEYLNSGGETFGQVKK